MHTVVIAALLFASAASMPTALPSASDAAAFQGFVSKYEKKYSSADELRFRFATYAKNRQYIAEWNARPDESFAMAENEFADMTFEEFSSQRLGVADPQKCSATGSHVSRSDPLPASVDWRTKGVVARVKNQGSCGSCWAFSSVACMESHHAIATGSLVELSEQNLVDCAGCGGGLMSQAFEYVIFNGGIDSEAAYPYKGQDGKCNFTSAQVAARFGSEVNISSTDEAQLQDAVAFVGPVAVAIDCTMGLQFYSHGVYRSFLCSSKTSRLNHGVLAVGYGTDAKSGRDYWIIKNSWGAGWGVDGYFLMERGRNMCGVASCASYPVV